MSDDISSLKNLVEFMIKSLVDTPDQVDVDVVEDGKANIFNIKVADSDRGKVIGRSGKTADAMRTILKAASAKLDKDSNVKRRPVLEILE